MNKKKIVLDDSIKINEEIHRFIYRWKLISKFYEFYFQMVINGKKNPGTMIKDYIKLFRKQKLFVESFEINLDINKIHPFFDNIKAKLDNKYSKSNNVQFYNEFITENPIFKEFYKLAKIMKYKESKQCSFKIQKEVYTNLLFDLGLKMDICNENSNQNLFKNRLLNSLFFVNCLGQISLDSKNLKQKSNPLKICLNLNTFFKNTKFQEYILQNDKENLDKNLSTEIIMKILIFKIIKKIEKLFIDIRSNLKKLLKPSSN